MDAAQPTRAVTALDVFLAFLKQGLTAFGGPVAHLAYFRREFVERRGWISEATFADLLALCHFLPGPASSQLGMAIGLRQAGLPGALAAFAGFTLPAGAAMIALALLTPQLLSRFGDGWVHGLMLATVAIVAQALLGMASALARGPIRAGMAIGAAAGLMFHHGAVAQALALAAGALFGLAMLRDTEADTSPDAASDTIEPQTALFALGLFTVLLVALPVVAVLFENPGLGLASVFYRTGALTFGGGHIVLPLLQGEVVGRGWIDQETFLRGYGVVQALPGPLFSFAGYIGAAQVYGPRGVVGGLIALFAIFLPSLLLVVGAAPFWDRLKRQPWARGLVGGVGAVVVGVVAAALWDPVIVNTVSRPADWALIAAAFVFLQVAKFPPWLVVIGFAVATGTLMPTVI